MPVRGGGTNRRITRSQNVTTRATRTRPSARVARTLPSSASDPLPPPVVDDNMLLETGDLMLLETGDQMLLET